MPGHCHVARRRENGSSAAKKMPSADLLAAFPLLREGCDLSVVSTGSADQWHRSKGRPNPKSRTSPNRCFPSSTLISPDWKRTFDARPEGPGPALQGRREADRQGAACDRRRLGHRPRGGACCLPRRGRRGNRLPARGTVDAEETRAAVEPRAASAVLIPGDVTDPAFCRDAVERTVRELGGLDILVNNAALQDRKKSLEDITDEQWDRTFRTNIYGYFHMAKAALPHLNRDRPSSTPAPRPA